MRAKRFRTKIVIDKGMCVIPLPFDPVEAFGRGRAPVTVTINGYTYRSTVFAMGGPPFVPLRKSNRAAAGVEDGEMIEVRVTLDTSKRDVTAPPDLVRALKRTRGALEAWKGLSYTHQREHVEAIEAAKKPETRGRRIDRAIEMLVKRV